MKKDLTGINDTYRKSGVIIGNYVGIWGSIDMNNPTIVIIGDYVIVGAKSKLLTHCPIRFYKGEKDIKTIIGNNVYIGFGCYILPGVKIGDNVVIGAGSIVSKDIPSNVVAVGNPCKVIRKLSNEEALRIKLLTEQNKVATGIEPDYGEKK